MSLVFAKLADDDAKNFQIALGTNNGICWIGGNQNELSLLLAESFKSKFVIHDGNDHVAHIRRGTFFYYHGIAWHNASINH